VELCDVYAYPIVSIVDTPGCVIRWTAADGSVAIEPGVSRWHARALMAHHHRTVPLFSVQLRRGDGLGSAVMGGFASGRSVPILCLAWPIVQIGSDDGFAAVHNHNAFDDVVVPMETRERIIRMLPHLPRRLERSEKKHTVDTW
jgi:acetyl-CoA carboxylase carboxyltransferase component